MRPQEYFSECATAEQVKMRYRELCKRYHPDLGKPEETAERTRAMQEINAAYALACATYRHEELKQKHAARGWQAPTEQDYADAAQVDERIREAIEKVIACAGLEIEICGLWVWVGGETKANKETLKDAGYKYAPQKLKWYFAGVPSASSRGRFDMDDIRARYGSHRVRGRNPYAPSVQTQD